MHVHESSPPICSVMDFLLQTHVTSHTQQNRLGFFLCILNKHVTKEDQTDWTVIFEGTCVLPFCVPVFFVIDFQLPWQQWRSNWRQWKCMCYYDTAPSLSSHGEGLVDCCWLFPLITLHLVSQDLCCAFWLFPSTHVTSNAPSLSLSRARICYFLSLATGDLKDIM